MNIYLAFFFPFNFDYSKVFLLFQVKQTLGNICIYKFFQFVKRINVIFCLVLNGEYGLEFITLSVEMSAFCQWFIRIIQFISFRKKTKMSTSHYVDSKRQNHKTTKPQGGLKLMFHNESNSK